MRKFKLLNKADSTPIPVLLLFGPTASGKTALAEKLFTGSNAVCQAEIISADSMQVYRGMNIGTAKPKPELLKKLPHHLIDIRNPDEQFNVGDFVRLADNACSEIAGRSALPVLLGGTGFYLKNFIFGLPDAPPSDAELREKLKTELAQYGPETLLERLFALDPVSAAKIHKNDNYRLLRALEVCIASGCPLSSFSQGRVQRPFYHFLIAGLRLSRDELYGRINERCETMFREGLAEEVETLFKKGFTPDDPGLRAIGYREFFIESEEKTQRWRLSDDMKGVKSLIARNSRRYAKRQETFFTGIRDVVWFSIEGSPLVYSTESHSAVANISSHGSPLVYSTESYSAVANISSQGSPLDLLSSFIHNKFNVKP